MIGIYKITNLQNGKSYIGQSLCIKERWKNHRCTAYNPQEKGYNYPLYRAIRKYGLENFSFEVIEECEPQLLDEKEIYWIQYYDTYNNGYNQTTGRNTPVHGMKITKEQAKEIQNLLKNTNLFQTEIAKMYDLDQSMISDINTGKAWVDDKIQYPIREKDFYFNQVKTKKFCINCGVEIDKQSNYCIKCYSITRRLVERPSREELKQLIRTKPFTQIGKMYNVSDSAIRKWCDFEKLPRKKEDINSYSDEEWELI